MWEYSEWVETEDHLRVLDVFKRDDWSVAGRAIEDSGGKPILVRRLLPSARDNPEAKQSLLGELAYVSRLDHPNAPRARLIELPEREMALLYLIPGGVELDRLLHVLEASGQRLSVAGAVVLIEEVLSIGAIIAGTPPDELSDAVSWGHGEIAPRSLVLGLDGLTRLYEARCAASGVAWTRSPDGLACLAPELPVPARNPSSRGDVYAAGAILAMCTLGISRVLGLTSTPLRDLIAREMRSGFSHLEQRFFQVLLEAVTPQPKDRISSLSDLASALDRCLGLESDERFALRAGLAELAHILEENRDLAVLPAAFVARWPQLLPPSEGQTVASTHMEPPIPVRSQTEPGPEPTRSSDLPPAEQRGESLAALDDFSLLYQELTGHQEMRLSTPLELSEDIGGGIEPEAPSFQARAPARTAPRARAKPARSLQLAVWVLLLALLVSILLVTGQLDPLRARLIWPY